MRLPRILAAAGLALLLLDHGACAQAGPPPGAPTLSAPATAAPAKKHRKPRRSHAKPAAAVAPNPHAAITAAPPAVANPVRRRAPVTRRAGPAEDVPAGVAGGLRPVPRHAVETEPLAAPAGTTAPNPTAAPPRRPVAGRAAPIELPPTADQTITGEKLMCVENTTIAELQEALAAGRTNSVELVRAYSARIEAYDRAGPKLNSVRELNPDAAAIAAASDAARATVGKNSARRLPLQGIPILLKDNIATADNQHTTAGSLALESAKAKRDATIVAKLRAAGAVILGKANLTEFANILALGMPSGYSSLGGQVLNPYATALDDHGIPVVQPGGSSAGSAVAVAAGFAAASIGTETSGSLLSPASQNGLVTVKPTVGLVSRAGIIPIASSQDTAGPMTRTVRDAAILLNVLAGHDPLDPATKGAPKPVDYTAGLDKDGLKGVRIGVPSNPSDPGNDVYWRPLPPRSAAAMAEVIRVLEAQGAVIVRENIPTQGWIGGPGTDMAVLNRNPLSPLVNQVARTPIVFMYELKHDMNRYLQDWATGTTMRTLGDIIAFNAVHADRALRFGQDLFLAAEGTRGDLKELEYVSARENDLRASRAMGLDAYMEENRLDAVLFAGTTGAAIAAKAGYPSVQVPAGFTAGIAGSPGIAARETPDYPIGATFTGRAWSEAALLRIAYAYEQATLARRMPPDVQALAEACRK